MLRREFLRSVVLAPAAGSLAGAMTNAVGATEPVQSYPSRTVHMVVPFPPGGPFDGIVRLISDKLAAAWQQSVVVENKPGAAGMVGAAAVAKAAGDGYTILFGASGVAQNPSLYRKMPYEPGELAAIARMHDIPLGLSVHTSLGVDTLAQFIARAKAESGKLSYGSISTTSHVLGEMLKQGAGIDVVRVPYRGEQPALTDLLGGQISAAFMSPGTAGRHPGKLKLLAVSGEQRVAGVAAPTFAESGFPALKISGWGGVFMPASTPQPIIDKVSAELLRVGVLPDVAARTTSAGFAVSVSGAQEFSRFVRTETELWGRLVKEFQVTAE